MEYYNRFVVGHRRQFSDTYELGPLIGKGAFGKVYRATRIGGVGGSAAMGEQVAVKQVPKESGVKMELLHNEITIWEQLHHPNLVRLLDVFENEESLSLVTEIMRGGDLFKKLEKATFFSEEVAAGLARQIVSAVAHLHAHGVVHCDLKPSNILVDVDPQQSEAEQLTVKIADFGLSQSLQIAKDKADATQLLTEVCGTPDYFAPELAGLAQNHGSSAAALSLIDEEGKGYGPPLDCWAVGCIVYELLAGTPPYQAQDEDVLFYKICENEMEFPSKSFELISENAIGLIKQFTTTDPSERLSCAEALHHPWLSEAPAVVTAPPLNQASISKNRRKSKDIRDLAGQSLGQRRASQMQGGALSDEQVARLHAIALEGQSRDCGDELDDDGEEQSTPGHGNGGSDDGCGDGATAILPLGPVQDSDGAGG